MIQFHKRGPEPPESSPARFIPGHLVRHRRYGYRGVVVSVDQTCAANEDWYRSNKTQPDRDQPWYHVLVHGSTSTTYAAEDSLMPDPIGGEIEHPLLAEFFSGYANGFYLRNERAWPLQ